MCKGVEEEVPLVTNYLCVTGLDQKGHTKHICPYTYRQLFHTLVKYVVGLTEAGRV